MVYNFFVKKSASLARSDILSTRDKSANSGGIKNGNMSNQELANELQNSYYKIWKRKYTYLL